MSLPHPVTFVCSLPEGCPDLFQHSKDELYDPDILQSYVGGPSNVEMNWVLRTYLILKRKKLNVSLSPKLIPGKICVMAPYRFRVRDYRLDCFTVGCRADFAKTLLCEMSIVQNKANIESEREVFIPHWPQPGLIPRLPERGCRVENMAFKGRSWNLYHEFRSPEFVAELASLGVNFESHDEREAPTTHWSDYRTCDLILAVRDMTEQDALKKPASKLINAWIAGVPAILGPEPAFREVRTSSLDYVEVKTPREALDAVRRFQAEPGHYQEVIANGFKRAEEFSEDLIAQKWVEALSGPVADQYGRWLKSAKLRRVASFPVKAIRQKLEYMAASYHQEHGVRIVSNTST